MILSDFLSQQKNDESDPSEIIPISFNAYDVLEGNRNIDIHKRNDEKYLIQTSSQAKTSGTKLPEVHRVRKELNPNLRPEKQNAMPKQGITEKPQIGQGRVGLRRRRPESYHINKLSDVTGRISGGFKIVTGNTNSSQHTNGTCDRAINNDKSFSPHVLLHLDLLHKPSPIQQNADKVNQINQNSNINLDIEENSPFRKASYLKQFRGQTNHFFKTLKNLKIS